MSDTYNLYGPITTSDTVDLPTVTDALWVGGVGNVVAVREDGQAITVLAVAAGTLLPLKVRRVNATSTTATNILALYQR